MKMTNAEYREFLSTFGFTQNYIKKWMNDVVFRNGVLLPFTNDELKIRTIFSEKSLHIYFELED